MNNWYEELQEPFRSFVIYEETVLGKSPKTVQEYYLDLRTFFRYILREKKMCPDSVAFDQIDISKVDLSLIASVRLPDVYNFLHFTAHERQNHAASRARKVSALRSFYKYLTVKTNQLSENPMAELDLPKQKKALPRYLNLEESIRLLQAVDGSNKARDYAIVTIFLNTGIRLSELCGINLSDIRDNQLRVTGKGNKERTVYLNEACLSALSEYRKVRPVDGVIDKNALFLSNRRTRISHQMVQNLVKKYIVKAGLDPEKYSVHKLRHTAATLMYRNGVDVRVLQEVLGHENLGTTQIYTHLDNEQLEAASQANPLSHMQPSAREKE